MAQGLSRREIAHGMEQEAGREIKGGEKEIHPFRWHLCDLTASEQAPLPNITLNYKLICALIHWWPSPWCSHLPKAPPRSTWGFRGYLDINHNWHWTAVFSWNNLLPKSRNRKWPSSPSVLIVSLYSGSMWSTVLRSEFPLLGSVWLLADDATKRQWFCWEAGAWPNMHPCVIWLSPLGLCSKGWSHLTEGQCHCLFYLGDCLQISKGHLHEEVLWKCKTTAQIHRLSHAMKGRFWREET